MFAYPDLPIPLCVHGRYCITDVLPWTFNSQLLHSLRVPSLFLPIVIVYTIQQHRTIADIIRTIPLTTPS